MFICLFLCLRVLISDRAFSYSLQEGYYCFLWPTTKNFLRHFVPKRDSVSYFTSDIFYVRNKSCCRNFCPKIYFLKTWFTKHLHILHYATKNKLFIEIDNISLSFLKVTLNLKVSITNNIFPPGIHHYERVCWLKFLIEFVQRKQIYSGHIQTNPKQTISLSNLNEEFNRFEKYRPKGQTFLFSWMAFAENNTQVQKHHPLNQHHHTTIITVISWFYPPYQN